MEILRTWDHKGWKKLVQEEAEYHQKDWNSTILVFLNVMASITGKEEGDIVEVKVPEHLRGVVEFPLEVNKKTQGLYRFDVTYVDSEEDIIEVNGRGLEIINFDNQV